MPLTSYSWWVGGLVHAGSRVPGEWTGGACLEMQGPAPSRALSLWGQTLQPPPSPHRVLRPSDVHSPPDQPLRVRFRVKKLLMPSVPDPKFTFPGLFEAHRGNFQVKPSFWAQASCSALSRSDSSPTHSFQRQRFFQLSLYVPTGPFWSENSRKTLSSFGQRQKLQGFQKAASP